MREWYQESWINRAKCMAHYLHRNIREAYIVEHSTEKDGKGSGEAGNAKYRDVMSRLGL